MRNRPRNHDDRALRILVGLFLVSLGVAFAIIGGFGVNQAVVLSQTIISLVVIAVGCVGALIGTAIVKEGC